MSSVLDKLLRLNYVFAAVCAWAALQSVLQGLFAPSLLMLALALVLFLASMKRTICLLQIGFLIYLVASIGAVVEFAFPSPERLGGASSVAVGIFGCTFAAMSVVMLFASRVAFKASKKGAKAASV